MPIYDAATVRHMKIEAMKSQHIKQLSKRVGIAPVAKRSDNVKALIELDIDDSVIDSVIRTIYARESAAGRKGLSLQELADELGNVEQYDWPCQQGQLDSHIQTKYTRAYVRFAEFAEAVRTNLASEVVRYATCSWYNTWSTHLIEEHISQHSTVVPTLKNVGGVDVFYKGQPFDVKVTLLPAAYPGTIHDARAEPLKLGTWYFENQSALRFGADNRMFIVVHDPYDPGESWKLKRDIDLIARALDVALDAEEVTERDEVVFSYDKKTYTALAKVIFIVRQ